MRKHRALLGAVLIPLGLFVAFYAFEQYQRYRFDSFLEDIDEAIDKELPPGSSADQISSFLDSWDVPHRGLEKYKGDNLSLYNDHPKEIEQKIAHQIIGYMDNYYNIFIFRFDINLAFFLDEERKLVWEYVSAPGEGIPLPW